MASQEYPITITPKVEGGDKAVQDLKKVEDAATKVESAGKKTGGSMKEMGDAFKELSGSLGKAVTGGEGVAGVFEGVAGQAGRVVQALGPVGIGVGVVVAAFAALEINAVKMGELADAAAEMADKLGVTITKLETMKLVAAENAGSVEGLQKVYDKLAKSMTKMDDDNEKTTEAFRRLGVEEKDLAGLTQEEIAGKLVESYESFGRSVKTTAAMMQLMGPAFREQIPSIKANADAHQDFAGRVVVYGAQASAALVKAGEEQEKATSNLGLAFQGLKNTLAEAFGDMALAATNWATSLIVSVRSVFKNIQEIRAANKQADSGNMPQSVMNQGSMAQQKYLQDQKMYAAADNVAGDNRAPVVRKDVEGIETEAQRKARLAEEDKAAREAAAYAKKNEDAIIAVRRQTELYNETSEAVKQVWENMYGTAKDLTKETKARLVEEKKVLDEYNYQADIVKQMAKDQDEEDKAQKRKTDELEKQKDIMDDMTAKAVRDVTKVGEGKANEISFLSKTTGMGSIDKEVYKATNDVIVQQTAALAALQLKFDDNAVSGTKYKEMQEKIAVAVAKSKEAIAKAAEAQKAYNADWTNGAKDAFSEYTDNAANMAKQTKDAFTNAFKGMEDALVNFAMTGKLNFADFAKSLIADIMRIQARAALSSMMGDSSKGTGLMGMIGSMLGSGGGGYATDATLQTALGSGAGFGFANGGVFQGGSVIPFASGGIVDRPTNFGMSGGRTGLMGESGIEAIFPIQKGSDGKLGVKAIGGAGGGIQIGNITIQVTEAKDGKDTANKVNAQMMKTIQNIADQRISEANRKGGQLNRW